MHAKPTRSMVSRLVRVAGASTLALAAGNALAATSAATPSATTPATTAATTSATPPAAAPAVQLAQASTAPAATAQRAAATPLKRNAQGQIESTETRNWAAIDRNSDGLISPDEMQAYLEASRR